MDFDPQGLILSNRSQQTQSLGPGLPCWFLLCEKAHMGRKQHPSWVTEESITQGDVLKSSLWSQLI